MKKILKYVLNRTASVNPVLRAAVLLGVFTLAGCKASDRGELLSGVEGREVWFHPAPIGMIYVPSGTIHTGGSEQDVFNSFLMPNKQVTITAFWMDETEITNNEYRKFIYWVIDSIARYMVDEDMLFSEDDIGNRYINYDEDLDWEQYNEELEDMFYPEDERFYGEKQIDTRRLFYDYMWIDYKEAARIDRDKYNPLNRKQFVKKEKTLVYPDTLAFVRDFTYSYNEPMTRHYFSHVKYDDYPVVGVNWHQAKAFCNWRSRYKAKYWRELEAPPTEDFRLPHEYEWEYAARGGRDANVYPWGGPYTRNSKGCMLANFKPLRGNYGADGGVYPVRSDAYFPNDYGLYNMSGNVAEWTATTYAEAAASFIHDLNPAYETSIDEYVKNTKADPGADVWTQSSFTQEKSAITLKRKVIRGGSWKDIAHFIECGARTYEYQDTSKCYVGFRTIQSYIGRSNKDKK